VNINGVELNPHTMNILRGAMLSDPTVDNLVPLVENKAISLDNEYTVCRSLNRIIRTSLDAMQGSEVVRCSLGSVYTHSSTLTYLVLRCRGSLPVRSTHSGSN